MRAKRVFLSLLAIVLGIYLAILVGLFLVQRSLIFPAPAGPGRHVPGFQRITYQTADGLDLSAGYRAGKKGQPVVVYLHGNGADWQSSVAATDQLVPAGYGVLAAEYRGYRDNPGKPDELGLYEDGRAAMDWLADRGVKPSQIVIIGNSIGGGVATQMATEHPVRALVLISPFASLPRIVAEKIRWAPSGLLVRDQFDNLSKFQMLEMPILLLHGDSDRLIPSHHSGMLAKANPRAVLVVFPGAGHELAWQPAAEARTLEFLENLDDPPQSGNR